MLLIQNGLLFTMDTDRPVRGDLLCDKGKILRIADRIAPSEQMQVIDASSMGDECNENTNPNPLEIASSVWRTIINGEVVWQGKEA